MWWVRAFITRSNGEITVETAKNAGTEFCVKIPVATPATGRADGFGVIHDEDRR